MTSISAVGGVSAYSAPAAAAPAQRVDPDHDGDNDKGKSPAAEASENGAFGPATKVTLSPTAQALLASQKA